MKAELGGEDRGKGGREVIGIELRTADERACHSPLLRLLPAAVLITRPAWVRAPIPPPRARNSHHT